MAISEDDIERVRTAQPISAVIGTYIALKRAGRNHVGLCPFHGEKTPSFNVRDETGRYKCFGCGASGDVFKFVQETERVDFVGAVEHLAAKVGITLNYTSGGPSRDRQRNKELLEVMNRASSGTTNVSSPRPTPKRRATTCARAGSPATWRDNSGSGGRPTSGTRSASTSARAPT